nr:MAG TPA: hypothetical protein [Caudoviricetes sp.]
MRLISKIDDFNISISIEKIFLNIYIKKILL